MRMIRSGKQRAAAEYADAVTPAHNGRRINILSPCVRARESPRSWRTVCYSGCLTKSTLQYSCVHTRLTCSHAPPRGGRPTVIFRLDIQLGIDKQTNRQNSGRRVILISNHFRRQKRAAELRVFVQTTLRERVQGCAFSVGFRFNDSLSDGFSG